jgi:hypothetical protein
MAVSRRKLRDDGNNQKGLMGSRSKLGSVRSRCGLAPLMTDVERWQLLTWPLTAHACLHAEEIKDNAILKNSFAAISSAVGHATECRHCPVPARSGLSGDALPPTK